MNTLSTPPVTPTLLQQPQQPAPTTSPQHPLSPQETSRLREIENIASRLTPTDVDHLFKDQLRCILTSDPVTYLVPRATEIWQAIRRDLFIDGTHLTPKYLSMIPFLMDQSDARASAHLCLRILINISFNTVFPSTLAQRYVPARILNPTVVGSPTSQGSETSANTDDTPTK